MNERKPMTPVSGLTPQTLMPPPARQPAQATPEHVSREDTAALTASPQSMQKYRTETDNNMRSMTVSIPPELLQELRRVTRDRGQTQINTVLDALSVTSEQLTETVASAQKSATQRPSPACDELFIRNQKAEGITRSTLNLRTRKENVAVIDNLVKVTGAASRSQMITAALREHLDAL